MTEHQDDGLEIDPAESDDLAAQDAEDDPEYNLIDEDVVEGPASSQEVLDVGRFGR